MEENKETEKTLLERLKEKTEKVLDNVLEQGIQEDNIDILSKMVDIHKDIANEEYWQEKKEVMKMRYRYGDNEMGNYGEYSDGYSDGGYSGNYGRRGVKGTGRGRYRGGRGSGRYRGEEMIDEMQFHYGNYSDGKDEFSAGGSYGAKEDTMKALDYMMKSVVQFVQMLEEEASSQEEMQIIKKYTKKISEM